MTRAALKAELPQANLPVARPLLPKAEMLAPYLQRIDRARVYSNFGPLVQELEARLAARCGPAARVCSVANATQGLALLLQALRPDPEGGLCLMPGFSFVATAHAAVQAGLTPWFLDVEDTSWMLTPAGARAALARAPGPVGAIVVVAAFGALPDLEGFATLSRETGVPVVLDAAAAFDSLRTCVLPAVVSLHATKVLCAGEGGYVVSDDPALVQRVRAASSFGFNGSRQASCAATNAKMSEYGAALALAALDGWEAARRRWMLAARRLRLAVGGSADVGFQHGWGAGWVSSTCVVRTSRESVHALRERLARLGVDVRGWWGEGLHREPAFEHFPREGLSTVERLAASTVGLPFFIDMDGDEIERVAQSLSDR